MLGTWKRDSLALPDTEVWQCLIHVLLMDGITGHYGKILNCLSWKDPVEKTLEATENLRVDISSLFFLRARQNP